MRMRTFVIAIVLTALFAIGAAVALNSTVFSHTGPEGSLAPLALLDPKAFKVYKEHVGREVR